MLELQYLEEIGRIRLRQGVRGVVRDPRWQIDEPPPAEWFTTAAEEGWTRDPFDRLIAAHAIVRRCRLASADAAVLGRLRPAQRILL